MKYHSITFLVHTVDFLKIQSDKTLNLIDGLFKGIYKDKEIYKEIKLQEGSYTLYTNRIACNTIRTFVTSLAVHMLCIYLKG